MTEHNPRYVLEDGMGLTVKNVSLQDSGVYTCRAEVDTDGRYGERKITVNVHGEFFEVHLFFPSASLVFLRACHVLKCDCDYVGDLSPNVWLDQRDTWCNDVCVIRLCFCVRLSHILLKCCVTVCYLACVLAWVMVTLSWVGVPQNWRWCDPSTFCSHW